MVAVPLIFGRLTAADYEDDVAADPRIDALRDKMVCVEDKQFTQRLPRSRQALDRQRASRSSSRTARKTEGSRRRVPDRPPPPAQGRHPGAGREVQDQPRAPLSGEAAARRSSTSRSTPNDARGDAGARVRRPDGDLIRARRRTRHAPPHAMRLAVALLLALAVAAAPAARAGLTRSSSPACGRSTTHDGRGRRHAAAQDHDVHSTTRCSRR